MENAIKKFIEISPILGINENCLLQTLIQADAIELRYKFPNGVRSLLEEILEYITKKAIEKTDLTEKSISNRIENLIKNRLLTYLEFKNFRDFLKCKKSFAAKPWNFLFCSKQIYKIADSFWCVISDNSTDFSFYTKRLILSRIYTATASKFINDHSYQFEDTFSFLHKKIENIKKFTQFKIRVKKYFNQS